MEAIFTKNLSKKFSIYEESPTIFNILTNFRYFSQKQKFYALKNINFSIARGDRIGLIGSNGSGKTTLLRVLAGIYDKTAGSININGKIAALLNSQATLERNLSALENIFLFGMIMGIPKTKLQSNLKEIVHFAGIGKFLHSPLRDFSTGMVQRLAFAILRYVEADIILIDEIFASSDLSFRINYLKALKKFFKPTQTIIISSHEMDLIEKFCNKALLLDNGQLIAYGPTKKIINLYQRSQQKISE